MMTYDEMLDFILSERKKTDDAINGILKNCGCMQMRPNEPPANPEKIEKRGGLFGKEEQD